jgi:ornithine cyclodeaminase
LPCEGDCHIKYGYLKGRGTFTVEVATGFCQNSAQGPSFSNGIVIVFSSRTGGLLPILEDKGYLTDARTAAAGALAAKYFAPADLGCTGVIGSGTQTHLQREYNKQVTPCGHGLL